MGRQGQEPTFTLTGSQLFLFPLPEEGGVGKKQHRTLRLMTVVKKQELNFSPQR